jgi:hypothetical protein
MLISVIFGVIITAVLFPTSGIFESERRYISQFPQIPSQFSVIRIHRFLIGLDDFIADQFPFRSALLDISAKLSESVNDNININSTFRGKDDWLIFSNRNFDQTVARIEGREKMSEEKVKYLTAEYVRVRDSFEKNGIEFYILLGPDKNRIYPEYLPSIIYPSKERYVTPLIDSLKSEGFKIYDPTQLLLNAKKDNLIYYRTDVHWNSLGAFKAFEGFRDYLNLPELPSRDFLPGPLFKGDQVDPLGYSYFPLHPGDNFILQWSQPLDLSISKINIYNRNAPIDKSVWVIGDSFALALFPYFVATYKNVMFYHHLAYKTVIYSNLKKPDIVIWITFEIHLTMKSHIDRIWNRAYATLDDAVIIGRSTLNTVP